jgi:hypothetical protein
MPKRGGARWPGAVKEDGGTTRIGWREVGDKADGRGPHGNDRREKRRPGQNVQSQRKGAFWRIHQGSAGRVGCVGEAAAYRGRGLARAGCAGS